MSRTRSVNVRHAGKFVVEPADNITESNKQHFASSGTFCGSRREEPIIHAIGNRYRN
jgi:hypothetical protein